MIETKINKNNFFTAIFKLLISKSVKYLQNHNILRSIDNEIDYL